MSVRDETTTLVKETTPFVVTGLLWFGVLSAAGLGIYWFTAPAQVAIKNRTFHQSQAYTDGMARDLADWRMAYASASDAGKDSIRATVRHRFAGVNLPNLPPEDRAFLSEMMQ